MNVKVFLFAILLTAMTAGLATAGGYGRPNNNRNCANSNSKACRDARQAFAEHHNGQYPNQYRRDWYQGRQGNWSRRGNNWQWDSDDGDQYQNGRNGWQWSGARKDRHHDRD